MDGEKVMDEKQNKIRIISAFPCLGKTSLSKKDPINYEDLESSDFNWKYDSFCETRLLSKEERKGIISTRMKNSEFPTNYVDHLEQRMTLYPNRVFFISMHDEVIEELDKRSLEYISIYPTTDSKGEFLNRMRKRGNNNDFISYMMKNYDLFIEVGIGERKNVVLMDLNSEIDNLEKFFKETRK